MTSYPRFLDVEASSFGPSSYPVSVAWSDPAGGIERLLISPEGVADWTDWDPQAEAVHGLDRQRLARNGWPPAYVADRLAADLAGITVYTDAPDYDRRWLKRLFAAAGQPFALTLDHLDELLIACLRRPDEAVWQCLVRLESLKAEVATLRQGRHDAGWDVGWLLALWRKATGEAVKMQHGIGPLPPATASGTFLRLTRAPR